MKRIAFTLAASLMTLALMVAWPGVAAGQTSTVQPGEMQGNQAMPSSPGLLVATPQPGTQSMAPMSGSMTGGMQMAGCPMMNGTMGTMGSMSGGAMNMSGMTGMSGMNGTSDMSSMSGMAGMNGTTGMSGVSGMNGTSPLMMTGNQQILASILNPWWLLGWFVLFVVVLGLIIGMIVAISWWARRSRRGHTVPTGV